MNRKCFASAKAMIIFILIFALTFCAPALGESYDAETMRLLRYEGDVEILNAEGQSRFVLENVRFASGEVMRTGKESLASVSLDDSKIVTLDAETRVEFIEESNHLRLNLVEGRIFLDVREKLDENESLDIQTSTMTVGIRGTMVCISHSEDEQISQTQIMLLEGKTDLDYLDSSGSHRLLPLSAGQKAVVLQSSGDGEDVTPAVSQLTAGDLPVLVRRIVSEDPTVRQRVLEGSEEAAVIFGPMQEAPVPENVNPYPDQGSWTWNETVTLVAQSASKLYDGEALTRSSNVLVYGLPGDFTIDVSARGSQTDVGESENTVSDCIIRNAMGEDVTSHFRSIRKISGQLVVNPIPVSVWTGSAEKYYDGLPLTNPEAGIRGLERTVTGQQDWENASVVSKTALGSEAMIAVSGSTWVHATNPITKESQDIELLAGQRLTVCVKNEQESDSIFYQIDTLKVEDLPDEILLLYANNPELLSKACDETGWDLLLLTERINALKASEESTVTKNGLTVQDSVQDRLMTNSASVNINIDSAITNYNSRALTEKEAHFTPIVLDSGITVTATGSQTEVGSSENGYTISWGGANENNYIVTGEELGTLTVLPRLIDSKVVISAASDSKTYDGTQLRNGEYTVYGLPAGYRLRATVSGSRTDAGITENRVTDYRIYGPSGEDVTDQFINVFTENGELAVNRAPLAVSTGSASKVYDGEALEYAEASLSGLVSGETAAITATGILPGQVGTADNTYEIAWGTAKQNNYYIASEQTGTLTIEPLNIEIDFGNAETSYNGGVFLPEPSVTYANGTHAGEAAAGFRVRSTDALFRFVLFTEDTVDVSVTGMGQNAGTYTLKGSVLTESGSAANWSSSFAGMTLTIRPCELTIETPSASKPYDGTALTAGPAAVSGLVSGETVTVTVTGSQTEVGESDNTYSIAWDTAKKENYSIREALGRLTVTGSSASVTLTASSASKVYDGTPLTSSGVSVSGLPEGFTVEAAASGTQTDAGTSANIVSDGYIIRNAAHEDKTASFPDIKKVDGTLTVEKAPVQVTTESASKSYDGTPLTSAGASITGLAAGETASVKATGSQTEKGSSANTYSIDWGTTNKDNYSVTENLGILEVTVNDTPVVLTAASASKTYDGTALTDDTVTAEGLPAGFTVSAVVSGSQTDAGSSANTIVSYTILD
ncbi:MAG: FecR domain-containing protein, partial [Clostridia bacterium]|nr:FecR domain-containing protein [Clostridia bacterium]